MKKRDRRPFVALHKELINNPEYMEKLSLRAKVLYQMIKTKYNPNKNSGLIRLPYREVIKKKCPGLRRFDPVSRAFKELINQGWLEVAEHGGLFGKVSLYRLTFKWDKYGRQG